MSTMYHWLSSLFLGLALILFVSPVLLYWFIHGDDQRYIWIINGPYPFSHFGSGPFQLLMVIALLFGGVISLAISFLFSKLRRN